MEAQQQAQQVLTIRGAAAQVRWVYKIAATVGPWTFEGNRSGGTVSAQIAGRVDAYAASQQPLTFVVLKQGKPWCWPIVSPLQITGETLTASLGPMERGSS